MDTSDANSKKETLKKLSRWVYPPDRPWIEFVIIITLALVSFLSMVGLIVASNNAKIARVVAVSRLEAIYTDLMKSENELRELKIVAIKEEREFHQQLKESMKVQNALLEKIATQTCVPANEINDILKKDPFK